jgi:hypothetical protein
MYHQINPTETFRERQLVLLGEAKHRRLGQRLRVARRSPKARSRTAAVLGVLAALVVAGIMLVGFSSPAHASTTFTVNSTANFSDANTADGVCDALVSGGQCTLRAAIQQANATSGADTINFDIPGSEVKTFHPNPVLPDITERLTIDGYTQPGASPNTLAQGTNAVLKIELDGSNLGFVEGLRVASGGSGSVIRGLVINRFGAEGIAALASDQNRIEGNFIGTDPSGTLDLGNGTNGVKSAGSTFNTIGGATPDKRNVISGNNGLGVFIFSGGNNRVEGNLIGTKKDGISALGNSDNGVFINSASNNTLSSNTIAFNGKDGVGIRETPNSNTANGNIALGNSIFSNVEEGIDLNDDGVTANDLGDDDTGANALQNSPLLTSAKTTRKGTTITGKLESTPNKTFLVQFFSNASGEEGQNPIGQAGVTTDSSGDAAFTFKPAQKVRKGKITATATDTASKNTSEFSAARKVVVRKRR